MSDYSDPGTMMCPSCFGAGTGEEGGVCCSCGGSGYVSKSTATAPVARKIPKDRDDED